MDCNSEQAFDRIGKIAQPETNVPSPKDCWWDLVAAFYRCAWFSRLWILQKIITATSADLYWGALSIAWRTVGYASTRIRTQRYQATLYHLMPIIY
jgi:hypothetical protein